MRLTVSLDRETHFWHSTNTDRGWSCCFRHTCLHACTCWHVQITPRNSGLALKRQQIQGFLWFHLNSDGDRSVSVWTYNLFTSSENLALPEMVHMKSLGLNILKCLGLETELSWSLKFYIEKFPSAQYPVFWCRSRRWACFSNHNSNPRFQPVGHNQNVVLQITEAAFG